MAASFLEIGGHQGTAALLGVALTMVGVRGKKTQERVGEPRNVWASVVPQNGMVVVAAVGAGCGTVKEALEGILENDETVEAASDKWSWMEAPENGVAAAGIRAGSA